MRGDVVERETAVDKKRKPQCLRYRSAPKTAGSIVGHMPPRHAIDGNTADAAQLSIFRSLNARMLTRRQTVWKNHPLGGCCRAQP